MRIMRHFAVMFSVTLFGLATEVHSDSEITFPQCGQDQSEAHPGHPIIELLRRGRAIENTWANRKVRLKYTHDFRNETGQARFDS